ncbi:Pentatricopeptide repeat-containing protein [Striga hermonthica]|uniref:Pentatricopeptide repeat-containing protein n=1 Tax=Striga hermonthica TaxID=68872 RepID=A0A9N7MKL8_STRHE|nr:Pentatricopeptide repeat-containing protein [Striga hermonthica]
MRSVVTWTVMVSGYAANGEMEAARDVFEKMPKRNFYVWSVLIMGYFRAGDFVKARQVFDDAGSWNVVVWNSLISGYAQNGMCEEVFDAFRKMREEGFKPDEVTLASVLSACAQSGRLDIGREIHRIIYVNRIEMNEFILNGLVDMYAKCGDLENARSIFHEVPRRNTSTWNSLITGYAIHGRSREAVEIFGTMEGSGEKPDSVTFLSVLSACAHGGFLDVGLESFSKMKIYGLKPNMKHYGCLVDLLGRAGRLQDAFEVIKGMPMTPNDKVLGAMLGACRIYSDATMAANVMELVGKLKTKYGLANDKHYVLLSSMYAESERWAMSEGARVVFHSTGAEKTPGHSALVI